MGLVFLGTILLCVLVGVVLVVGVVGVLFLFKKKAK